MLLEDCISLSLSGSISGGGWTCSAVFSTPQAIEQFDSLEVRLREGWGTPLSYDEERLIFRGHVFPQSFPGNWERQRVEILATTSQALLSNVEVQAIGFAQNDEPQNEHQFQRLTIPNIIKHILKEHTNFVYDPNTNPSGWMGLDYVNYTAGDSFSTYVVPRNTIWQAIESLAGNELKVAFFTKDDKLYYDYHPAFTSSQKIVTLTPQMWNSITIIPLQEKISQLTLSGQKDEGFTFEVKYPPVAALYGKSTSISLRVNSDALAQTLARNAYLYAQRNYDVEVKTWLTDFEIGDKVGITFEGCGVSWLDKIFTIENIDIGLDFRNGRKEVSLRLSEVPS